MAIRGRLPTPPDILSAQVKDILIAFHYSSKYKVCLLLFILKTTLRRASGQL